MLERNFLRDVSYKYIILHPTNMNAVLRKGVCNHQIVISAEKHSVELTLKLE